eukprot:6845687-Alexandrium_andersonii.AAC.1
MEHYFGPLLSKSRPCNPLAHFPSATDGAGTAGKGKKRALTAGGGASQQIAAGAAKTPGGEAAATAEAAECSGGVGGSSPAAAALKDAMGEVPAPIASAPAGTGAPDLDGLV